MRKIVPMYPHANKLILRNNESKIVCTYKADNSCFILTISLSIMKYITSEKSHRYNSDLYMLKEQGYNE